MKKLVFVWNLSLFVAHAASVLPADYLIKDLDSVRYIYPSDSELDISEISSIQHQISKTYSSEYGYSHDRGLSIALASQRDQIANGFATQIPLNEQVFYGAGVLWYDYFASTSWIKNLLIHESAHTFQLAPAKNFLSKFARQISGHSWITRPLGIPLFPYPNITIGSYILEGNAVLNESLWGNGGRLYSGYGLAEMVTQARAGNITPEKLYNFRYRFPGGEKFYLVGGHFQKFLADRYGLNRVNSYFGAYSEQPFPFFANSVFRKHYGKDFVELTREFSKKILLDHQGFVPSGGQLMAKSQISIPIERSGKEIYTLVSDRKSAPKLMRLDIVANKKTMVDGGWRVGKIIKIDDSYYTQSSARTSPAQISVGLFDKNGYIKKHTASKVIQGYTSDHKEVYLSVPKSWDQPHLYVGSRFYGIVNSSVFVRGNDLYYFKQHGSWRILYRNHTRLTSYQGHYGMVCDVDNQGKIYFVANSKHGSTVYRYDPNSRHLQRVSRGDDIIGFKLSSANKAIVQTITAKGYEIREIKLHPTKAQIARPAIALPQKSITRATNNSKPLSRAQKYHPIAQMRFSSLTANSSYTSSDGYMLDIKAYLTDPLWQNTLSFVMAYRKQHTLLGASYTNSAHRIHWGGSITTLKKHAGYDNTKYRNYGYSAYVSIPLWAAGYWRGSIGASLSKPYDDLFRSPINIWADMAYRQQFGYSKYPNSYLHIPIFVTKDRDTIYAGARFDWMHDISNQSYLELKGAYLYSSQTNTKYSKGLKIGNVSESASDKATLNIPSLRIAYYAQKANMLGVGLYKVFDYEWLNYHLPISLLRESVYLKHNIYSFDLRNSTTKTMHESIVGLEGDMLMFHKALVPIRLELLYNNDVANKLQLKLGAKYRF